MALRLTSRPQEDGARLRRAPSSSASRRRCSGRRGSLSAMLEAPTTPLKAFRCGHGDADKQHGGEQAGTRPQTTPPSPTRYERRPSLVGQTRATPTQSPRGRARIDADVVAPRQRVPTDGMHDSLRPTACSNPARSSRAEELASGLIAKRRPDRLLAYALGDVRASTLRDPSVDDERRRPAGGGPQPVRPDLRDPASTRRRPPNAPSSRSSSTPCSSFPPPPRDWSDTS